MNMSKILVLCLLATVGLWIKPAYSNDELQEQLNRLEQQLFNLRQTIADQQQRILEQQEEIRNLRGSDEVLTHQLKQVQKQQQDVYGDLDKRLRKMHAYQADAEQFVSSDEQSKPTVSSGEQSESAIPSSEQLEPTVSLDEQSKPTVSLGEQSKPAVSLDEQSKPIESVQPPDSTGIVTVDSASLEPVDSTPPPAVPSAGEEQLYQRALISLRERQYRESIKDFQDILNRYPTGKYTDNAQYWIGEAYYALKEFDNALHAFNRLLDSYPKSLKRPHALLKIGYVRYETRDYKAARAIFEQVRDTYPDTDSARLAIQRLQKMQSQGF